MEGFCLRFSIWPSPLCKIYYIYIHLPVLASSSMRQMGCLDINDTGGELLAITSNGYMVQPSIEEAQKYRLNGWSCYFDALYSHFWAESSPSEPYF